MSEITLLQYALFFRVQEPPPVADDTAIASQLEVSGYSRPGECEVYTIENPTAKLCLGGEVNF